MASSSTTGGEQNSTAAVTGSIAAPTFSSGTASTNPYGQTMAVYFIGAAATSIVTTLDGIALGTIASGGGTVTGNTTVIVPPNSQIKITSAAGAWVWATI